MFKCLYTSGDLLYTFYTMHSIKEAFKATDTEFPCQRCYLYASQQAIHFHLLLYKYTSNSSKYIKQGQSVGKKKKKRAIKYDTVYSGGGKKEP